MIRSRAELKLSRTSFLLILIIALALFVRLGAIHYLGDFRPAWTEDWENIAQTIITKGYFGLDTISLYGPNPKGVTSFIPPLYPGFMALSMYLFGSSSMTFIRIVQAIFSTLAVLIIFLLGRKVFQSDVIGLVAALMAALFPPLVGGVVEINPVTFEVFFLALFLLLLISALHSKNLWLWVCAGIILGIGALIRPTILMILPFLIIVLFVTKDTYSQKSNLRAFIILLIAAGVVILPWTIRNYLVHHEFIPISTNGGINFWIGNNPQATGEFINPRGIAQDLLHETEQLGEGARDRFFLIEGLRFIWENPTQFFRLLGVKLYYFLWSRPNIGQTYSSQDMVDLGRFVYLAGNALLLPLWLIGLILSFREWRRYSLLYAAILSVMLVNILFFVGTRYRTPAAPYQILFASFFVLVAFRCIFKRKKKASI
ncbi:MAG: hypothetical protein GTO18_17240 [Anaerolineales bacterium]|nr:hypothetical protein [Anaerolineales bacterium]